MNGGAFSRPRDRGPQKKEVRRSDTYPGAVNLAPSILLGLTEKIRKKVGVWVKSIRT